LEKGNVSKNIAFVIDLNKSTTAHLVKHFRFHKSIKRTHQMAKYY